MKTSPKRLILFDIDGTLLRTKGLGRNATAAAMLEVFGTASTVETHHFGGKTDWYTLVQLLREHGYDEQRVGERMPDFVAAMGRHMNRLLPDYPATPLLGALTAVTRVRNDENCILGLVTGNTPASAEVKLRGAGFDFSWFEVGAFGSESVDRNDLPNFALDRAREYCGCKIARKDVVIIGDTVMDVAAARAVGGLAIAVRTGYEDQAALEAAEPDHLLDDLTTLFDVL